MIYISTVKDIIKEIEYINSTLTETEKHMNKTSEPGYFMDVTDLLHRYRVILESLPVSIEKVEV